MELPVGPCRSTGNTRLNREWRVTQKPRLYVAAAVWKNVENLSWSEECIESESRETELVERRLAYCDALLACITTGVAIFEPVVIDGTSELRLVMANDIVKAYFAGIGTVSPSLQAVEAGFRESGYVEIAQLVSVTGQAHHQEGVSAPSWAVAGHRIDLSMEPLATGAVMVLFDDVTYRNLSDVA